jgi:hypothetical protein
MSTVAPSLPRHADTYARAAWVFLSYAAAVCVLYVATRSELVAAVGFGTDAGGAVVAISVGVHQHQPSARFAWRCVFAASALFLIGGVLRMGGNAAAASSALVPALFTVAGYCAVAMALLAWLRTRNVNTNTNTLLDTVLIGLGAALASWALLTTSLIAIFVGDLGDAINTAGLASLNARRAFPHR